MLDSYWQSKNRMDKKGKTKMRDGGKGDKPRPLSISQEEFDAKWDAIFNKPIKEKDGSFTVNVDVENQDAQVTITYKENI